MGRPHRPPTGASDLTRLGQAARDRGLYRHAAALWTRAATLGSADAARQLIAHLRQVSPDDATRAARWAAAQASLDDPRALAWLLEALLDAGASDAVTALPPGTPPARSASTTRERSWLLRALREAGASDAVTALAARAAAMSASTNRGRRLAAAGAARAGASDAISTLWPATPPATPASTTREESLGC